MECCSPRAMTSARSAAGQMLCLEKTFSKEIQDNISRTLTPFFGLNNFQISVATRINPDKKQTHETVYDPDSRVERSVRVVRSNETSQNSSNQSPTTVTQNLPPNEVPTTASSRTRKIRNARRRPITKSRRRPFRRSAAASRWSIFLSRFWSTARAFAAAGGKPTPEAIAKQLADLEQIIASAAGANQ